MVAPAITATKNKYLEDLKKHGASVWKPQGGPQILFHQSAADEVLYGGAAGGGKSESLLVEAVRYSDRAGYHGILFRRTFPELGRSDGLIMRSKQLFWKMGEYRAGETRWYFKTDNPNDPATLSFSHMERLDDMFGHQSAAYTYIGFDEVTSFLEEQYLYLISRGRSTRGIPIRYRAATNPGNEGHDWVFRRWGPWLDPTHYRPADPGEIRWFARIKDEDVEVEADWVGPNGEKPLSRTFIPAFVTDNPALLLADPGYMARLDSLPEPYRSQLRDGNWLVGKEHEWQVIPTRWVRDAMDRWHEAHGVDYDFSGSACDPARGTDKACLGYRRGPWVAPLKYFQEKDTMYLVGEIQMVYADQQADGSVFPVKIDVIGVGAGLYDRMRQISAEEREKIHQGMDAKTWVEAWPVNSSEKTPATDRSGQLEIVNLRAEMWWHMRELLDPDNPLGLEEPIQLPPDQVLLADLTAPRWRMTSSGIIVESKLDIKKRINRSTDAGDTVIMMFYEMGGPGQGRGGIWL